jgi:hypothetical protein
MSVGRRCAAAIALRPAPSWLRARCAPSLGPRSRLYTRLSGKARDSYSRFQHKRNVPVTVSLRFSRQTGFQSGLLWTAAIHYHQSLHLSRLLTGIMRRDGTEGGILVSGPATTVSTCRLPRRPTLAPRRAQGVVLGWGCGNLRPAPGLRVRLLRGLRDRVSCARSSEPRASGHLTSQRRSPPCTVWHNCVLIHRALARWCGCGPAPATARGARHSPLFASSGTTAR